MSLTQRIADQETAKKRGISLEQVVKEREQQAQIAEESKEPEPQGDGKTALGRIIESGGLRAKETTRRS